MAKACKQTKCQYYHNGRGCLNCLHNPDTHVYKLQKKIEQLQAELKDKTKMLEKYGKHVLGCKLHTPGVCFCTCGFDQALQDTDGKDK
ncbi:hypothetical protein LCGC14_0400640 [marine sediment metagenome]|uniref:Uncharacterized protein n=1 Tax=marine sediment metagenome TaxID=412755 RepID=A0A0F9T2N2_9ZZZZ